MKLQETFLRGHRVNGWQAVWITPEEKTNPKERPGAGYLRRTFVLTAEQAAKASDARALLAATAHGLYDLRLNGEPVTDARFTPGCDEYGSRLQYQVYDVTERLREGENTLFVTLGDGWYRGCVGIDGTRNLFGTDLSFLAELRLGEETVLKTDGSWEGSMDGPIRLTDLELGETYDARQEITGWHAAREEEFGFENLVPTDTLKVTKHEAFPGKAFTAPDGSLVFDFGQNLAGFTSLLITGAKAGQTITVLHGETLDENGNFTQANFQPGDRNKAGGIKQELNITCAEGALSYEPLFSVFGFRYAKVVTDIPAENLQLTAHAVYSDMAQTAAFSCGDERINRLFANALWSMKGNFLDIPTDCPTRERAGWTGDAGAFVNTGTYLMDARPVFEKWLANLRTGQHKDGSLPFITPKNGKPGMIAKIFSASVGWGDAGVIVPWELYRKTGDKAILEDNYDMMRRWVGFLVNRARKSRIKDRLKRDPDERFIIDTGMDYGEWNEPGVNMMETMKKAAAEGQPEVATAYLAYSAGLLANAAEVLGKTDDARRLKNLRRQVTGAYRRRFLPDGHIHSERQCEYVRPIALGLLTPEEEKAAAADLNALVVRCGYHLNTGFLSTPFLLPVLADHGYADTAYRVLLQEDCPGWLYAVGKGATTIWECWDGIREDGTPHDSLNHYSYGTVAGFLITGTLGIRYDEAGLSVCPHPDKRLGHAEGYFRSPEGEIAVSWRYEEGKDEPSYVITVPEGLSARVSLPDGRELTLTAGRHNL